MSTLELLSIRAPNISLPLHFRCSSSIVPGLVSDSKVSFVGTSPPADGFSCGRNCEKDCPPGSGGGGAEVAKTLPMTARLGRLAASREGEG